MGRLGAPLQRGETRHSFTPHVRSLGYKKDKREAAGLAVGSGPEGAGCSHSLRGAWAGPLPASALPVSLLPLPPSPRLYRYLCPPVPLTLSLFPLPLSPPLCPPLSPSPCSPALLQPPEQAAWRPAVIGAGPGRTEGATPPSPPLMKPPGSPATRSDVPATRFWF